MVLMVGRALMVRMPRRLFLGRGRGRLRPGCVLVMVRGLGVLGLVAGCVMVPVMGVMGIRVGLRAMVVSVIATLSPGRGRGRPRQGRVLVMVRGLGVLGLVMVWVMRVVSVRVGWRVMVVSVIAMLSIGFRGAGMLIIRLCLRSPLPLAGVGRSIEVLGAQM